jgi:hypothetical protein
VLYLQHPVLVFVFKQKIYLSLSRCLGRLSSFFFPSFSGSCLVCSSLSEVWLVLRFWRSALWFTSHPAFASPPSSGARSEIRQLAPCYRCYAGLLIVFQFCNIVLLWMLLPVSRNELCGLLSALFQAVAYHLLAVSPSAFLVFVY